ADLRSSKLDNFFHRKNSLPLQINSMDLISGKVDRIPVNSDWGKQVQDTLLMDGKEKSLQCGVFFISGKLNVIGKLEKGFAPLYLFPAALKEENEVFWLSLNLNNGLINPAFYEIIRNHLDPKRYPNFSSFERDMLTGPIDFRLQTHLESWLQQHLPDLNIKDLDQCIRSEKWVDLLPAYRKRSANPTIRFVPGAGLAITPKPKGSRGVLNELETLRAQKGDYALVLDALFNGQQRRSNPKPLQNKFTPVSLSPNQLKLFTCFDQYRIGMAVGPPGTGKSFTIAAMASVLISQGKSVLIATKNQQAGKVIAKKIAQDFGLRGVAVVTATASYTNGLKTRVANFLNKGFVDAWTTSMLKKANQEILNLLAQIEQLESDISLRAENELKWGYFFATYRKGFFSRFKKQWIKYKASNAKHLWDLYDQLARKKRLKKSKIRRLIRKEFEYFLQKTLNEERQEILQFYNALIEDKGAVKARIFDNINFQTVLHALPVWIVNTADVHQSLPLNKELFDLVIFDEASQCDIASALPLLQRAKSAIVVGDPNQLNHISFLSRDLQQRFAEKLSLNDVPNTLLNYRDLSILDLFNQLIESQHQICFLNEHFRSFPDLIAFSNQQFYEKKLSIMTSTPVNDLRQHLFLVNLPGKREKKGHNPGEANFIIDTIQSILEEEKDLPKSLSQRIGILSPFRDQVNYLKSLVREKIPSKSISKHQLLIGTPFHFQGEEKDIMLLSFAIDPDTHPSTLIYLNKPDVFNVSITRARTKQYIVCSYPAPLLPEHHLLHRYLTSIQEDSTSSQPPQKVEAHDQFLLEVRAHLKQYKLDQILMQYPVAGIMFDLVLVKSGKTICIDLVGFPGDFEEMYPVNRWQMLERMNIPLLLLAYSTWYLERRACKRVIRQHLEDW
ncbi:MAG: AAA domain-containing protein, partial [Bacteroidota bacterium]